MDETHPCAGAKIGCSGKLKRKGDMRQNAKFLLTHPLASRFRFVRSHEAVELLS
jgi:hypothetical protein